MDLYGWDVAKILAILAGIWKIGVWLYKRVVKPIILFVESHNNVVSKLDYVVNELKYNGGNSTKDQLRKITELSKSIDSKLNNISIRQESNFELSETAMFECDKNGECVRANIALCKLFGATKEQMMGFGWSNFIEQSEPSKKKFIDALESDNEITDFYTIKNGNKKAGYTAMIKRDSEGKIKNIMGKVFLI